LISSVFGSGPIRPLVLIAAVLTLAGCDSETPEHAEPGVSAAPRHTFPGPSRATEARVTGVSDGDTITLSGIGKARLIGVDTPEVHGGAECYGENASDFTRRALRRSETVRYRLGQEARDRYGRALVYVWLDDGRMLNGLLVERGYALALTVPPNVDHAERFVAAAARARRRALGLWAEDACGGDPRARGKYCSDFSTQVEAQEYFEGEGRVEDVDGDRDGVVCETLP
jgi:micrococcal nuclease